jgi:predicted metallo-beta-lactamase superfamily hydrolase
LREQVQGELVRVESALTQLEETMKKTVKKLVLTKETVRSLDYREMMKEAVGGYTQISCMWACFATKQVQSECAP